MNIHELDSYDLGDAVKFNDKLNPRIWGADEKMRPEVREQLLRIADDFREFLGIDVEVKDITVSGSNAAYTYTPHSDIDLHLVVDLPRADESEVYRELFDAKKYAYNDMHDITIGGSDVELYVQDANKTHHSQGIYSIMNDDWVSVPKRRRPDVDDISVRSKYEDLGHRIEKILATGDYEKIAKLAQKIKEYRQAGLDAHGEFGPENLAFKMLRTQGLIEKLFAARNAAKDALLSLDERKKKKKKKVRYGYGAYWYPGTAYAGQDHPAGTEGGDGGGDGGESRRSISEVSSTPDGVNPSTTMVLSDVDRTPTDEDILRDFIDFCVKELKIEHMPRVKLRRDPQWPAVHKTFGRYNDDAKTLEVAWGQRHIMDVLRTVAHELTHKHQHEREGERMGPDAGETGSPYENEANARAGVLMRDYGRLHPEYFAVGQASDLEESASGYIPTKAQAKDPRFSMALTVDIKPGQVGKEANKLKLKTDKQGHPQIARANGLFENLYKEYKNYKADEDYSPDEPPGPEFKPTMPAGTLRVDVSDVYDWYKLGQHISNMKGLGKHDFGAGPPSTIISFGDEDTEHKFIDNLKATGLDVTDIDPRDPKKRLGPKIKTDPTYNVDEAIQAPVPKDRDAEQYYNFIVGKARLGRPLTRAEQDFVKMYQMYRQQKLAETAQSESEAQHGWRAELVDEINATTYEVKLTNRRSRESANFVVRPVDMIRSGVAGPLAIDSMDIQDLQTGETRSIQSDSAAPWVYILDAVDALFYDTPALQQRLKAQLQAHDKKGLPLLPGLKQRQSAGQGMAAKDFVAGQDAIVRAQSKKVDEGSPPPGLVIKKGGDWSERYPGGFQINAFLPNNKHVGMMVVYPQDDGAWIGEHLVVDPEYQRQGIGTALWDFAERTVGGCVTAINTTADGKKFQRSRKQEVTEDEDLDEVKMSPSALEKFATSKEAQGIRAGFEAELIFRDTQGESDEMDPEPDYDADERAYSIQQVIEFFDNDEYGYGMTDRERNRLEERLDETYMQWRDEQMISDFRNDAEDLIRDVLLAETPMSERIGMYLTDSMQKSDEEADRIVAAGADAPRFTKSSDQEAYASENPDYAVYLEAAEGAEAELEESVEYSVSREDEYWDEALDDYRDNYSGDDDSFFSDVGLRWMSDVANEFGLDWPVWNMDARGNDGSRDWDDIGVSLQDTVGMPVKVSTNYHSATRREGTWIVEPDGSLSPDDKSEEMGLEIVSPPMPLLTAIEKLKQVVDWANDPNGGNAYTNSSTGLHMGVSLPKLKNEDANDSAGIDYVKLILFMGDKYVQQQFGRSANTYCASALDKLKQNIKGGRSDPAGVVDLLRHGLTELAYRELQKGVGTSKYTSAHLQDGYIEFRSPGGDWLAKGDEEIGILENTMLRFARAMAIAGDPNAERQEYAKKLYKLVTTDNEQYADQLRLFSEFSAGTISKEQLKKQWADTVLQKELPSTGKNEYEVYSRDKENSPDAIVGTLYAKDYDSAYDLFLKQYGRDINNLDVRVKQPWFDVFDDSGRIVKTIRARDIDTATDRAQYEFGERWTDAWNIYRRPDNTPEPKVSPRAQVAKRIVTKPKTATQYNYDIVDQRTVELRVVDRFRAETPAEAEKVYSQWLKSKDLPNDTADYGYRKSAQSADDQRDSVAIQRRLGVQDVNPDVAQNFEPRRQNWELVSDEDPDRVVHRMTNATTDEVMAWIRQQEAGGMPPGLLRTRIVAEAIDPVSGAGAVPPRQDPKSISKTAITPVDKANLDAVLTHDRPSQGLPYKSAIGKTISKTDLENLSRQIQMARKLGDDVNESEVVAFPSNLGPAKKIAQEWMQVFSDADRSDRKQILAGLQRQLADLGWQITYTKNYGGILRHLTTKRFIPLQRLSENFADGRVKGRSRPGRVKRAGASCNGSVTDLRARAKKYGGERGRMYHWCANMKSGRKK